jgi:hypothetical protein
MPRSFAAGAIGLWLASLPFVATAQQAVVVELYTSQGCSACPPADAFLGELTKDPRVIPLALHVDYWDYIGWADVFAQPGFTRRQHAYAKATGSKMVYTPQLIIAGQVADQDHGVEGIWQQIEAKAETAPAVGLTINRAGDVLTIRAEALVAQDHPLAVQLVRYAPEEVVTIERGENAGQTITYHNVVTGWDRLAEWDGKAPLEISAEISGDAPAVIIVQRAGPGEVLAAARVE